MSRRRARTARRCASSVSRSPTRRVRASCCATSSSSCAARDDRADRAERRRQEHRREPAAALRRSARPDGSRSAVWTWIAAIPPPGRSIAWVPQRPTLFRGTSPRTSHSERRRPGGPHQRRGPGWRARTSSSRVWAPATRPSSATAARGCRPGVAPARARARVRARSAAADPRRADGRPRPRQRADDRARHHRARSRADDPADHARRRTRPPRRAPGVPGGGPCGRAGGWGGPGSVGVEVAA